MISKNHLSFNDWLKTQQIPKLSKKKNPRVR